MARKRLKDALKGRNLLWVMTVSAAVTVTAVVAGAFFFGGGPGDDSLSNPLILLAIFNSFLLVTLLYLLFRQLVRGYLEWRRVREGARIRTRLLSAFVLLGLLPSTLLLIGAVVMIESAVDSWFRLPVHTINEAGQRLVDASLDLLRKESQRRADAIAGQLASVPGDLHVSFLYHLAKGGDIDAIGLIGSSGETLFMSPPDALKLDRFKVEKCFSEDGLRGYIVLGTSSFVISSRKISPRRALVVGYSLPQDLLGEARYISENQKLYLQAKAERKAFKISMISSFLALTLAVVFAAVWVGTRLTREISSPLQLLLEGTGEVSRGNLEHRIDYPAKDEIGQVVSSFNRMVEDLRESKREIVKSNEELRAASESAETRRNYIEVLMESLNVGIISLGADGEVINLNKKAREFLGMTPKDPPQKMVTLPSWTHIRESIADLARHPGDRKELPLSTREEARIFIAELIPLPDEGQSHSGRILILEDVTDLSRTQRIAAWQEVARRLAHEIKNPLTPIRLSAQRIRKKAREEAPDLGEAILDGTTTIEREVESMMNMVNEFSRFARLPEVKLKPGNLQELILSAAAPYQIAYPKVKFVFAMEEGLPGVMFDQEQLERVIKNLFENSIEAMKMAGEIRVSVTGGDKNVAVAIRDTGPGIPVEVRSKMFLPYFSTKKKGTGLGLAIVARILEEHGGRIEVDEHYQDGAGLVIFLPR